MKKILIALIAIMCYGRGTAQQILLFAENFQLDTAGSDFNLNTAAGPSANTGNNQWVVNRQYKGQPLYPNTPPEDSIANGGMIDDAPYSYYLHIHDVNAVQSGIANDNWDTSSASDRFCYIGSPFCTAGLTNVYLTFFWICQGDSSAYGQVYYSANGGPWIQTGKPKYYNQSVWLYESISDTAFNNLNNLQFGFRWVNPKTTDSTDVSFGLDDVFAIGNYDSINNPTTMSITLLSPDTICQGSPVYFSLNLSQPLCDGSFEMEMSNAEGNFSSYYPLGEYVNLGGSSTFVLATLNTPDNLTGNCFKLRVIRTTPPVITSDTSACFAMIYCAPTIYNLQAPVMLDVDTTCLLSEIDVYFNSTGVYAGNNTYIAELSDSTGNFADSTFLGNLPSSDSFPNPMMPGDISGLIPANVPPGCGYYIRVRSTNPVAYGPPIGPFCLTQCDVLTNNHTDLHFCVSSGPYPECDTLRIKDHEWTGNSPNYDTCNKWIIQLLNMMTLAVVNTGGIGVYYDSVGGLFNICMPSTVDSLPVPAGEYYMRIISTCSSESWNETGSIIRITIGAPASSASTIYLEPPGDSDICKQGLNSVISLFVDPFNSPPSNYIWTSNLLNNGDAFTWPYEELNVQLNSNVPAGTYKFYVQESNFGCLGPISAPAEITIIGSPKDTIHGLPQACVGDTETFNVSFQPTTVYQWSVPPGVQLLNNSNVEAKIIFDTVGNFVITCYTTNACSNGPDSASFLVKVVPPFTVQGTPDTTVCAGQPLNLGVQPGLDQRTFLVNQDGTYSGTGGMFNLVAHDNVIIDSFAVVFLKTTSIDAKIFGKNGSYIGYTGTPGVWALLGSSLFQATAGRLSVIPASINLPLYAGDTFAFYVTSSNNVNAQFTQGNGITQGAVFASDGLIDFDQGTKNVYPFGSALFTYALNMQIYYSSSAGLHYIWSNGDTGQVIRVNPLQSTTFSAFVTDSASCSNHAVTQVTVDSIPQVYAGPDTTVCPDSNFVMQGSASTSNVLWQPGYGLSDSTTLNPVFNFPDSVKYYLIATGGNGCKAQDSVLMGVIHIGLTLGQLDTVCEDVAVVIPGSTTAPRILWSPAQGLSSTDSVNPVFSYAQSITYQVTAFEYGCALVDTYRVNVEECVGHLMAPSAFSPNGDGHNDYFTVFGENIASYEIRIYNRWGEEVYSSNNVSELNQANQGWDGTYKGKKQDAGNFVYYISAKDFDGKNFQLKGSVILIR